MISYLLLWLWGAGLLGLGFRKHARLGCLHGFLLIAALLAVLPLLVVQVDTLWTLMQDPFFMPTDLGFDEEPLTFLFWANVALTWLFFLRAHKEAEVRSTFAFAAVISVWLGIIISGGILYAQVQTVHFPTP